MKLKLKLPLALTAILLFSHTSPGSSHDSSRMAMIENLITKHVWWTDGSRYFNAVDMVMDRGHFYSDKPPIFSLYSAFIAYPLKFATSFDTATGRKIFYYFITIMSSGLGLIGLCLLMRRALLYFKVPEASRDGLILATVTGTCILPVCLTYVTHTAEAVLLFGTFLGLLYYSDRPQPKYVYWMGFLTGLNIMVHPFVGGLYSIITAGYFMLRQKYRDLIRFCVCVMIMGFATLGINQLLFGTMRPYYTMPEKYLFMVTDGKKVYQSGFMLDPTVQGLTEEMVARRFGEQGYPDVLRDRTIERLRNYKKNVQTNAGFIANNWMKWDFIFFNPLVVFCIVLTLRGLWRADRQRLLQGLWILTGVFGLYISSIFQRSMPGGSFGNRYMIAALPPLFVFAASELKKPAEQKWFWTLYGSACAGALIGSMHPWHTPAVSFAHLTMPVYTALAILSCLFLSVSARPTIHRIISAQNIVARGVFFALLAGWSVAQCASYYQMMPDQLIKDLPRLTASAACFLAFVIWRESGVRAETEPILQYGKSRRKSPE